MITKQMPIKTEHSHLSALKSDLVYFRWLNLYGLHYMAAVSSLSLMCYTLFLSLFTVSNIVLSFFFTVCILYDIGELSDDCIQVFILGPLLHDLHYVVFILNFVYLRAHCFFLDS